MTLLGKNIQRFLEGELEPLLLTVLDGQASESEFTSLLESLRESQELRKRACLFVCDQSILADEICATRQAAELVDVLSLKKRDDNPENREPPSKVKAIPFRMITLINGNGLLVAALALLVIIGLFVQNSLIMSRVSRLHSLVVQGSSKPEVEVLKTPLAFDDLTTPKVHGQSKVVGRVIGLQEIAWHPNDKELTFGDSLKEGQKVRLISGSMEVLLANGAKVTVEGPVDFEATSLVSMDLNLGKVVAAVPRTARGYTIMTPTTEVVDIGTQFGLTVDDSGATELHVFDGDVVARSLFDKENSELIHAKENEAIGFNALSSKPRRFAIRESDFVRWLGPTIAKKDFPAIPITDDLSLWYAADMILGATDGEAVSVWRDILAGDNKFANDARQFELGRSPTFTMDEQGRSSLHFNGTSTSLLIDPIESKGSCTIFIVCVPERNVNSDKFHGSFLYKLGEAPSLELSLLADQSARGWLWPGPNENRIGVVQGQPMSTNQPNVLAYRYDSTSSTVQLWTNGVETAVIDSSVKLPQYAHAWLGSHSNPEIMAYFGGNIYEVAVYESSLDDASMEKMSAYFYNRYSLNQNP